MTRIKKRFMYFAGMIQAELQAVSGYSGKIMMRQREAFTSFPDGK